MSTFVEESMAQLLAKHTPEEISGFIDVVIKMQAAAVTPANHSSPKSATIAATAATLRKKRTKKAAKSSVAVSPRPSNSIAPTRPLNSWMAFRSYHAPIFTSFQQKNISGFLKQMWQTDPFKAKWSILAKAYSMIREYTTKDAAPLDIFLSLTGPYIGVIPREEYLAVMGWEIVKESDEKKMERRFEPDVASFPEEILTTNFSSEDIVSYCHQVSYVETRATVTRSSNNINHTASLTMAAQPTTNSIQTALLPTQPALNLVQSPGLGAGPVNVGSASPQAQQDEQDERDVALTDMIQSSLVENNGGAAGASRPLRQSVHDLSDQQFPFYNEFDPNGSSMLDYDPFSINPDSAFSANSLGTYLAPGDVEFPESFSIDDFLSNELFDVAR